MILTETPSGAVRFLFFEDNIVGVVDYDPETHKYRPYTESPVSTGSGPDFDTPLEAMFVLGCMFSGERITLAIAAERPLQAFKRGRDAAPTL
jgi:hypothetical protein